MKLNWIECKGNKWCGLETVNLNGSHFDGLSGVYVIWHSGGGNNVVRVGQGNISERLYEHKNNTEITKYNQHGKLLVSWASVPDSKLDGVEVYLASELQPLVGVRFPESLPIQVNLPGR